MRSRALLAFLVVALFAPLVKAQIPVSDDAFTSSAAPNANYGISLGLVVQSPTASGLMASPVEMGGFTANTYLKFDLSALPPNLTAGNLSKANLRLYVDFVVSPGTFDIYQAAGSWNEGTLTASNAPGIVGAPINQSPISVTKALKYIDIDITSAFANGQPGNGLVLVPSTGSSIFVSFDSKENPLTSHDPELSVSVNDASSSQLQQEIKRATQAENTIATNLANETTRATGAEMGITNALNTEIANRVAGDSKALASANAYTDASVLNEATQRANADNTLQGNITAVQNSLSNYAQLTASNKFAASQLINGDLSVNNVNASGLLTANGALLPAVQQGAPQGSPSNPLDLAASVSDGTNFHNETFRWQAVPVNNGTPNFAAQLSLMYGVGVTPVPTGFFINSDGTQNFVPNQVFNGMHAGDGSGLKNVAALTAENATFAKTAGFATSAGSAATFSGSLGGDVTGGQATTVVSALQGVAVSNTLPQDGQVLGYSATAKQWQATTPLSSGGGAGGPSILPAFLPGALTTAYTAASFTPDSPITVTHISAALKTAPDLNCPSAVLRVSDGTSGQDLNLIGGQNLKNSGSMSLKFAAGSNLNIAIQKPANCPQTNPGDANVIVEYRGQQSSDQETCAESGLVCNGICEETQIDLTNCGACGKACNTANGTSSCNGGICGLSSCNAGFGDCDNNPANGCETNLQTSLNNCGACGSACVIANGTAQCAGGKCTASSCNTGLTNCGNACSSLQTDVNNCGGCGFQCTVFGQGTSTCTNGNCQQTCSPGYTACSNIDCSSLPPGAPCPITCSNLQTDIGNCGACNNFCPDITGPGSVCVGGQCTLGVPAGGACLSNNACLSLVCSTGLSNPAVLGKCCAAGQSSCNNSCTNLTNDSNNCGVCGNVCDPTQGLACSNGACVSTGATGARCAQNSDCVSGICDPRAQVCR